MSFVRIRKTQSATGVPRKKKAVRKKPVWDDTVQDLTTLRATPEEIAYRKASHQSKHALVSRLQRQNRLQEKAKKQDLSISNAEARQLAIMKEVLFDQYQFQKTIAKSDEMMNQVKDLFGDDPKRYAAFPRVTSAPSGDADDRGSHLVGKHPDIHTRMETLSESIMDGSALNDFEQSDSDEDYNAPDPITYQPKMNMERFQQFLASEEKNQSMSTISGQAQLSQLANGPIQSTQLPLDPGSLQTTQENVLETPKKSANDSIRILRTPRSAINDTKKIKKTKKRVAPPRTPQQNTSALNLTDLRKVLEGLQDEIAEYEKQTGRRPAAEKQRQESFSGYTLSLIDSVTKISRYMKENDIRLRAETTVREQLMQDVSQMASLIDALTSDIILTQEEHGKLQREFEQYKMNTETEIALLKSAVQKAGLMENRDENEASTPPRPSQRVRADDKGQPSAIPDHLQNEPSAVLLSPPVRKTRLQREQEQTSSFPSQTGRQTSLIDVTTMGTTQSSGNTQAPTVPAPVGEQNIGSFQGNMVSSSHPQSSGLHQGAMTGATSVYMPTTGHQISGGHGSVPHSASMSQQINDSYNPYPNSFPPQNQQLIQNMQPGRSNGAMQGQGQLYSQGVTNYPGHNGIANPHGSTNVAARVTVPRPSPLVQSNVGVPIQGMINPNGHSDIPLYQQNRADLTQRGHGVGINQFGPGQIPVQGQNQPVLQQQGQGQSGVPVSHTNSMLQAPQTNEFNSKNLLAAQIAELNKQHEEAQLRLQSLMQQQKQTQEDHKTQQLSIARVEQELQGAPTASKAPTGNKAPQQKGLPSYPVSPPISPISQKSDKYLGLQGLTMNNRTSGLVAPRGITVAIPGVSMDTSTDLESSPSPRRA